MQTHIDLAFGDGTYRFQIGMGQILAIEEKCGPIGEVYRRTIAGRYEVDGQKFGNPLEAAYRWAEIIEICRQGLMGGKSGFVDGKDVVVSDHMANHLVSIYLHPENGNSITKAWDLAAVVLHAVIAGYEPAEVTAKPKKKARQNASTEARSSETPS